MLEVSKIRSDAERISIMLVGTDILSGDDLDFIGKGAALDGENGSMYHAADKENQQAQRKELHEAGFSVDFIDILVEANRQGYGWVWFDREVETVISEVPEGVTTNMDRSAFASFALHAHIVRAGNQGEDAETNLSDLLCDLRHYCDVEKIAFMDILERSEKAYLAAADEELDRVSLDAGWNAKDEARACREGWVLQATVTDAEVRCIEIVRWAPPPRIGSAGFMDDAEAVVFVVEQAAAGSSFHRRALITLCKYTRI